MSTNFLFAIDQDTDDVIISDSPKGIININFIERIGRKEHEMLYNAVQTHTAITKDPNFNKVLLKAVDKVCQLIYNQHKELKQAFYRVSMLYVVFK
jgi:hypothetical protein